ncbi:uncharacterized protein LOC122841749 isoform X2 [Gambusia affinis]|nr:uncharacterized protein LOC122841749 isoform X2 [Gambusia affinis]
MRSYHCDALTFGKRIQLTVSPKDDSPVSPTLFLLSPLQPAGSSQNVGSPSGPNVCLAAGFRPKGADMVLRTTGGPISLKTSAARLSPITGTYYYPGFSDDTIRSCSLDQSASGGGQSASGGGQSASGGGETGNQPEGIHPEKSQQNFWVLLISAVRLILAKAVTFNTILTVRTLTL